MNYKKTRVLLIKINCILKVRDEAKILYNRNLIGYSRSLRDVRNMQKIVFRESNRSDELNLHGPRRFNDDILFIKVHCRRIAELTNSDALGCHVLPYEE